MNITEMTFLIWAVTPKINCVKLISYKQRGKKSKKSKPRMHLLYIPERVFFNCQETHGADRLVHNDPKATM